MKATSYILYIIMFPNYKVYVGYTSRSLEERKKKHYESAKHEKINRTPIMNAIKKYNNQEVWHVIDTFSSLEEVHSAEIECIKILNSTDSNIGYNLSLGGDGVRHTALTKAKIGIGVRSVNKRRFSKKENIVKQSKALTKYWSSEKVREEASRKKGGKPFIVIDTNSGEILGEWQIQRLCAKDLGVSPGFINNVLKGRRVSKGKYTFKYRED
jgi:hypothetical protein